MTPPDYAVFFQFAHRPFSLTPDPRFYFRSRSHGRAFEALTEALGRRDAALMLLIGDLGVGKTTLLRTLIEREAGRRRAAFVSNALLSPDDLLRRVLQDLGAMSAADVQAGRLAEASRVELVELVDRRLRQLAEAGERAVVIVDEAHSLPARTTEQLVEIASLDANRQVTVQFLLVGQPAGGGVVPRVVENRAGVRARLLPLERDECARYIDHRLGVGGGGVTFARRASDAAYALSGGLPRIINLLGERALHEAAAARSRQVEAAMIESAASALDVLQLRPKRFRWYAAR